MTGPEVLVVAPSDDLHARAVAHQVESLGGSCLVFDPATLPVGSRLELAIDGAPELKLAPCAPLPEAIGEAAAAWLAEHAVRLPAFDLGAVRGVWWRRARPVRISRDLHLPEIRAYAEQASRTLLRAAFSCVPVHNPLDAEDRADRKPYQLVEAHRAGLPVPPTLVTTDPDAARAFVRRARERGREVIYKHTSNGVGSGIPTRQVDDADLARLDTLVYAPVTFQERMRGGPDLRVAMIGDQVFGAEWRRAERIDTVDVRLDPSARMWPTALAPALEAALRRLHRALGLTFAVIDLKLDEAGTAWFLEVNPTGQWLDLEVDAGLPLSEAWARVLLGDAGAAARAGAIPPLGREDLARLAAPATDPAALVWQAVA